MASTLAETTTMASSILNVGENCWRTDTASRAALIVDAADYYRHARQAMMRARNQIMLIGWDFDTRIDLDGDAEDDAPRYLGPFLSWLARKRPDLHIYILKWDVGAIKLLGRGTTLFRLMRWMQQPGISFKLDGAHPAGASHHQKLLVIDDALAFCGGIDMTAARWDTRAHKDDDPHRRRPTTGRRYGPWHDATMAVEGNAAKALGEHARIRWEAACGGRIAPPPACKSPWPDTLDAQFTDIDVSISRTRGATDQQAPLREIERLFVDMIGSARRFIYAENQYFASRVIAQAIEQRLVEPNGPEIVLVNPATADGWLEEAVMGPARAQLLRHLQSIDRDKRLRVYTPVTQGGEDIYVHAKITIVDDLMLRVGSANMNNRSMGLDSECDLTIDARLPGNEGAEAVIGTIRADLMGEHLGVKPSEIQSRIEETRSLIETVEALRGSGRSLRPFEPPEFSETEEKIAESQVLDPESADEAFEPAARPGLLRRLRHRRPSH
jgi:phosphatidylserine/phosphatidylglycerophosphate/cardiolipin synthase-like enzyme